MALETGSKVVQRGYNKYHRTIGNETEIGKIAELEYLQSVFAQRQSVLECLQSHRDLVLSKIK